MSELLLPIGGGGGTSSDELTATKAQVLAGYTAVTKDSNDEAITGTMPDNNSTTSNGTVPGINDSYPSIPTREGDALQYNVDTTGIARISMCPPRGYYSGGGGSYVNRPASDFGNAPANRVVAGNTFTSSAGLKVSGTIVDRGLYQSGSMGQGTDYYAINCLPEGWYHSDGNDWAPEARISKTTLRNYLGVNAAIIKSGNSIAGVAGTLSVQSAISFSAAAISYNTIRISWKNPAKGPWQGVFIQMSTGGNPGTGGGSRAYTGRGNSSSANASNYVDITGLNANTTYYFTCTSYVDNLGWGTSYNVSATTAQASIAEILGPYIDLSNTYIDFEYSYVYNEDDGAVYRHADRRFTSISGEYLYTDLSSHYTSSNSSSPSKAINWNRLRSRPSSSVISVLNTYCNRLWVRYRRRESDEWRISTQAHYGKTGSGYGYTPANITFAESPTSSSVMLRTMISLGNKNAFFEEGNNFYQLQFFKG